MSTKNRRKNKLGCLPTSAFFYAFELGTKQKDQVVSIEPSSRSSKRSSIIQLVLRGLSNKGLIMASMDKIKRGKINWSFIYKFVQDRCFFQSLHSFNFFGNGW